MSRVTLTNALQSTGAATIGVPSSTAIAQRILTLFGNVRVESGPNNINGVILVVVGSITDYHRHRTINGLTGAFAGISDHGHNEIQVANAGVDAQMSSVLFTSVNAANAGCTHTAFVAGREALGSDVNPATEISIDTTGTVPVETPPGSGIWIGRVVLNFSGTSTGITTGQRIVLEITGTTVAGIEAANYSGTVFSVTTSGGNTAIAVDVSGLDAVHWRAAGAKVETELNGNWSLAPISVAVANATSIAPVANQSAVDITFSSVPSDIVIGRQVSVWFTPSCTVTGPPRNTLVPGSVFSITGTTVRVLLRNVRRRQFWTMGGTADSTTANWSLHLGVADPVHEPTPGGTSWNIHRRHTDGVVEAVVFGPCDVGPSALRSAAVGLNIRTLSSDAFRFGTDDATNVAELVGSRLTASGGFSTGTARWTSGTGSPEGVVTAPVGSLYTRTDGGANTTLYVKESGTGNTGWAAK